MSGKKITLFEIIVGLSAIIGCIAAVLVVPEFRNFAGLDSPSPEIAIQTSTSVIVNTEVAVQPSETLPLLLTPTEQSVPISNINLNCQNQEQGATLNGVLIASSSWKGDCAFFHVLNGENIVLTTWGILIVYNPELSSAKIIQPNVSYTAPPNSVLFAGYINSESVVRAYQIKNPNAPTPMP